MKWTRRDFVGTGAGAALITAIAPAAKAGGDATEQQLRAVMDEIIPRGGKMPSASEAGGLEYFRTLQRAEPQVAEAVLGALKHLNDTQPMLTELQRLEKEQPAEFLILRNFVYEAYYTQQKVWDLVGYHFHGTDNKGPQMKPFDEAVIQMVRTKPKHYRDA